MTKWDFEDAIDHGSAQTHFYRPYTHAELDQVLTDLNAPDHVYERLHSTFEALLLYAEDDE